MPVDQPTMSLIHHGSLPVQSHAGCCSLLVAGAALGPAPFEVRTVGLAPGASAATPDAALARVVVVLSGAGKQRLAGEPQAFQAPCTLIVPAGAAHEIVNNGVLPMQMVVIGVPPMKHSENNEELSR
ncbi:MAG TPA: cupin domain-containing protein [Methylibium sp.]|nr:cupin domain-containing protein [Methylibium sp.]